MLVAEGYEKSIGGELTFQRDVSFLFLAGSLSGEKERATWCWWKLGIARKVLIFDRWSKTLLLGANRGGGLPSLLSHFLRPGVQPATVPAKINRRSIRHQMAPSIPQLPKFLLHKRHSRFYRNCHHFRITQCRKLPAKD